MIQQILTIDLGGTKTRMVQFNGDEITQEAEFPTVADPDACIAKIVAAVRERFPNFATFPDDKIIVLATRGLIKDDKVSDERLGWSEFPIAAALGRELGGVQVLLGNDAKLGTLGAFPASFRERGLYLTLGTGIGAGLMINGNLSRDLETMEVGKMKFWHDDQWQTWESFASGHAFSTKYNDPGSAIPAGDQRWRDYAVNLATGIVALLPVLRPDQIVIGGGISRHFDKFADPLRQNVANAAWQPLSRIAISVANESRYTVNRGAVVFARNRTEQMR